MKNKFCSLCGIPSVLFWGYIGLFLFVLGSGIESSWFSAYLIKQGFTESFIGLLFTCYGIAVAISSWWTGFLVNLFGFRRVLLLGLILFVFSSLGLLVANHFFWSTVMLILYTLRGGSYPLVVYSLLILITMVSPMKELGRSTSWYWIFFNLGLTVVGPSVSTILLTKIGGTNILAAGIILGILGSSFVLYVEKKVITKEKKETTFITEISQSFLLIKRNPPLFLGILIKSINNIGQFGFVLFMPLFLSQQGFSLTEWGSIWAMTYIINILASIFFGRLGDRIGWRKVLLYFSGTITGVSCLLIYFVAYWVPGNVLLLRIAFGVFAVGIAAYSPLTALMPAMEPKEKASTMSLLNLGSGLSNFIGPLLVTLLYTSYGAKALLLVFSGAYFLSTIFILGLPEIGQDERIEEENNYETRSNLEMRNQ